MWFRVYGALPICVDQSFVLKVLSDLPFRFMARGYGCYFESSVMLRPVLGGFVLCKLPVVLCRGAEGMLRARGNPEQVLN